MANYKVVGIGQHGKYFDDNAYHDIISYIIKPGKAAFANGAEVTSVYAAAQEMQATAQKFGKIKESGFGTQYFHSTKQKILLRRRRTSMRKKLYGFTLQSIRLYMGCIQTQTTSMSTLQ